MGQAWGETSAVTLASRATLHMSASCVAQLPSKQSSLLACRWHALAIAGGGGAHSPEIVVRLAQSQW